MANQRKLIGRLPVFKGEWSSSETYSKLNEVTLYGSSFRSKIDGNTYKPAELNEEGTGMTVNENWYVVANGTDAYLAGEKIASIDGNTSTYNVSRFHQHTGFWEAVEYDESEPAYLEAQEYTAGNRVNLVNYTNHTFVAMKDMTGVMPDYNNISNKFTLEEAILFVPSKYRLTGMNVGFLDSSNKPVVHKHKGGTFTNVANWEEDIQTQLTELSSVVDIYNRIVRQGTIKGVGTEAEKRAFFWSNVFFKKGDRGKINFTSTGKVNSLSVYLTVNEGNLDGGTAAVETRITQLTQDNDVTVNFIAELDGYIMFNIAAETSVEVTCDIYVSSSSVIEELLEENNKLTAETESLTSDLASLYTFKSGYVAAWAGGKAGQIEQNESYSLVCLDLKQDFDAIKIDGAVIYNIICYQQRPTYTNYNYELVIPAANVSSGYIQRDQIPKDCSFIAINFENSNNTYENLKISLISNKRETEIGVFTYHFGDGSVLYNYDILSHMVNKGETVTIELSENNITSGNIYIFPNYPFLSGESTLVSSLKSGINKYTFIAPIEGFLRISARYTDLNKDVICKVYSRSNNIIVYDGDSQIFGTGSDSVDGPIKKESFARKLQKILGAEWRDINQGYPGDTVQQIAGRIGVSGLYFSENVILKADGSETQIGTFSGDSCIIKSFFDNNKCPIGQFARPFTKYAGNFNPCCIFNNDKKIYFDVYPIPSQRQTQSDDPMYVKPLETLNNDITINADTIFYPYSSKFKNCDVVVIWQGNNNNMEAAELLEYHKRVIDYHATKKFILIGRTSIKDTTSIDNLKEQEQLFQKEFGPCFFNIRKYMNEHGLEDAGLSPTAEDLEDIAAGKCPRQLQSDGVHFIEIGHKLIAYQLYNIGRSLGYWS